MTAKRLLGDGQALQSASQFIYMSGWISSKKLLFTSMSKAPNRANGSARRVTSAYGSTST